MGSALLTGWMAEIKDDLIFTIIDPSGNGEEQFDVKREISPDMPPPDLVVLAMKPQMMAAAIPPINAIANEKTVFLSIAAGITMAKLKAMVGKENAIIRTMPNTPAAIGKGITAMIFAPEVPPEMIDLTTKMMAVVGEVVVVDDENLMDAVTAVSGSGPAYIFLMREALQEAAKSLGLAPNIAEELAAATLTGAAAMMSESDIEPSQLRQNVTSPNGTTQAALDVLMAENGLQKLMDKAVQAAYNRSKELGK